MDEMFLAYSDRVASGYVTIFVIIYSACTEKKSY